ncbi:MAG: hypothetical protein IJM44_05435 [Ruminococcus sp.]|nr:hypothetical protein [Ruminococcus sp.]
MGILDRFSGMKSDKRLTAAITALGIGGLLLILLSSVLPGKKSEVGNETVQTVSVSAEEYCRETEQRLEGFISQIEGAGRVRVYLTVGTDLRYVYATEDKLSRSDSKTEEEEKYVMIGNGSDKSALIETVQAPAIVGAVVACTGADSPAVQEKIYRTVSAALGLPTSDIFVTKLKGE